MSGIHVRRRRQSARQRRLFLEQLESRVLLASLPPLGLVSWWRAENNLVDFVGTNDGGTLVGGATFAAGKVGQAFSFDGADDFVEIPDAANLDFATGVPFSIELWAFRTSEASTQHLLGKRIGNSSDDYNYQLPFSNAELALNAWTHVVHSFDGSLYRVFYNGSLFSETVVGNRVGPENNATLRIGTSGTAQPFGGLIDEVKIFNRALTQTEVQASVAADSEGAATQVVTTAADIVNASDAVLSLREAITASNTVAARDVIGFDIPNMPTDTTSWYKAENNFNNATGSTAGMQQGGVGFAAGKVGQAFSLDGVDDQVTAPQSTSLTSSFTFDAWINPSSLASNPIVMEKGASTGNRIGLQVTADGRLGGYLDSSTFTITSPPGTIAPNRFTHVAYVFDDAANQERLYADGRLVASATKNNSPLGNTAALVIGKSPTSGQIDFFTGLIDEVDVFPRALSGPEVHSIFQADSAGKVLNRPGLVSWFRAEDNPTDAADGNHATSAIGAPQFVPGQVGRGMKFDGNDGFIVPDNANLDFGATNSFSVETWFRVDALPAASSVVLEKRAVPVGIEPVGYSLAIAGTSAGGNAGKLFFTIQTDNISAFANVLTTASVADGQLHHVSAVVDRSAQTLTLFLDGVFQQMASTAGVGDISNTGRLFIGHNSQDISGSTAIPFNGVVDELGIYNRPLSAGEIRGNFTAGSLHRAPTGVMTTIPTTALPTLSQQVIIDGYTQPGSTANTLAVGNDAVLLIELNGIAAASTALTITAGNSTARGLVINRFSRGVVLQTGGGNTIAGNFIGTNAAGTTATGFNNVTNGILFDNSPGNTIGGTAPAARNVILGGAGNRAINALDTAAGQTIQGNYLGSNAAGTAALGSSGIQLFGVNNLIGGTATGARNVIATSGLPAITLDFFVPGSGGNNIVQGNYIGVTADGNAILGNGPTGIFMATDGNTIGGTTPAARNVIVTGGTGVQIGYIGATFGASNNTIQGNYIGLNAAGTTGLPGLLTGIGVSMSDGANNLIGGTVPGAGNVIAGFALGIQIGGGSNVTGNFVQGNFIGTNPAGTAALANINGIRIAGSGLSNNTVGGTAPGAGNVISGNTQSGVIMTVGDVSNTIQGNFIGLAADGTTPLGNGLHGINILGSDGNTAIGGLAVGAGNRIAFNGGDGVFFNFGSGTSILGNSIHSNGGLGIDLNPNGVTPNDNLDADIGPNNLQNFPIITGLSHSGGMTTIQGRLNSTANTTYRVELFDNTVGDPSGHGEGQFFLGAVPSGVTTDATGAATFSFVTSTPLPGNRLVAATATDPSNNTSEFGCSLVVTTTADSGLGSLRAAINCANGLPNVDGPDAGTTPDPDVITFAIPGSGVQTISPATALPTITDPVIIDGYTQPGASANTLAVGNDAVLLVELNGNNGIGAPSEALTISAGGSTVRGLVVNRFGGNAITLQAAGGNTIEGNWLGLSASGATLLNNVGRDIFISTSLNNLIGGTSPAARNVLAGSPSNGALTVFTGASATIQGNYVGMNAQGTAGIGASGGIDLGTSGSLVGGTAPGAGNVISGTRSLNIGGVAASQNNIVQGNTFGLDATGTAALANNAGGVLISNAFFTTAFGNLIGGTTAAERNIFATTGAAVEFRGDPAGSVGNTVQGNYIGLNVAGTAAPSGFIPGGSSRGVLISDSSDNRVGGTATGAGNVIANYATGVEIYGTGNIVQGNFIGTNAAGTVALGNLTGVLLANNNLAAINNTIGGAAAGAGNLISGNNGDGIRITPSTSTGNLIQGNRIGLAANGTAALGNGGDGVEINGGTNNVIGGVNPGEENVIANSGGDGVFVVAGGVGPATGNAILRNSIFSNFGLGIDLGTNGPTPNDTLDPDTGANNLQNFPVLTSVNHVSGTTTIQGTLNSLAGTQFRIELFSSVSADSSGFGEGQAFFGTTNTTTNGIGNATFSFAGPTPTGTIFTATATRLSTQALPIETSEFSAIQAACSLIVINTLDSGLGSLRDAILCANNTANIDRTGDAIVDPDPITFNFPGSSVQTITPVTALPTVTESVIIDGYTQPGATPNTLAVGNDAVHLIELNGSGNSSGTGGLGNALTITAGGSTVRGLVINRFNNGNTNANNITLQTGGGNTIEGCFLGLDPSGNAVTGTATDPGAYFSANAGVVIQDSPNNIIGGTTPAARNVIAARGNGISINNAASSGTTIQGNYIGINAAGTTAFLNTGVSFIDTGIRIGSSNNMIGGDDAADGATDGVVKARNVISGTASTDIASQDVPVTGNVIQGNYLGTNATGTAAVSASGAGITLIRVANFTVGGTSAGAGNLISGHGGSGISIANGSGPTGVGNTIQGNLIGTNAAGTAALPNFFGIQIVSGQNNTIGGTTAAARNIISGNNQSGVLIGSGFSFPVETANVVQGNFIGTDITGTVKVGNAVAGVFVNGVSATGVNTIGGTTTGARNIISGNQNGIIIGNASNTLVQGNFIGTDAGGTGNLGNTELGISLNASNNTIGGVSAGAGNIIAFNGTAPGRFDSNGISVSGSSSSISIRGNSIFSNAALGINLAGGTENASLVTANDPADADTGANNLQNFPVITSVTSASGMTTVQGTLNSTNGTFNIDVYVSAAADPSGNGEGQTYVGSTTSLVAANNGTFTHSFPTVSGQGVVSATATDASGNTSEFSAVLAACSFVVTNSSDTGPGSFRDAILCANNTANIDRTGDAIVDPDPITFNIPGSSVQTITPVTVLPTITESVIIDGYTQPGASANTLAVGNDAVLRIELTGNGATFAGLTIAAGNSTVRGLVINGFSGNGPTTGITLTTSGNNTIAGNFIGTNAAGTAAPNNNNRAGISIEAASAGNTIGGLAPAARNVILGNAGLGAVDAASAGNTIQGNYIGSNAAGTAALGQSGLRFTNANNLIGGTAAGARNVISTVAAGAAAITFLEGSSNNNIVQGNYIGLTADGNAVLGTGGTAVVIQRGNGNLIGGTTPQARNVIVTAGTGVSILGTINLGQNNTLQGNYIGTNAAGTAKLPAAGGGPGVQTSDAAGNTIGGTALGAGNVIAGRTVGVDLQQGTGGLASGNLVQGNFIGTNAAGTASLGNVVAGVRIGGFFGIRSSNNTIGGTAAGAGNLISGNTGDGISIGAGDGNFIQGNRIGVAANGTTALGNGGDGIKIADGNNNTVGGTAAAAGNVIAFNNTVAFGSGDGVSVNFGVGNAILGNSIHSNAGLGIDLGANGPTANDNLDPDSGPNNLQNFPVITGISVAGANTTIQGKLNSLANTTFRIELFDNAAGDPSGHGEGQFFLAPITTTTDATGNATFSFVATTPLPGNRLVAATATDPSNNTSEFGCSLVVTTTADSGLGSLRAAINCANGLPNVDGPDAGTTPDPDVITFAIPASGVQTISPVTELPTITESVVIDGYSQTGSSANTQAVGNNAVLLMELTGVAGAFTGLTIDAGASTVRGLVMNQFGGTALVLQNGDANFIEGNWIGTNTAGTAAAASSRDILVNSSSTNNTIGGTTPAARNVLAGSGPNGAITLLSGGTTTIQGNYIGTNAQGTAGLGTSLSGSIAIATAGNTIGGTVAGAGNVISGSGITITFTRNNIIQGNFFGLNASGTTALANNGAGVFVNQAQDNQIGGTSAAARNVFATTSHAVQIQGVDFAGGTGGNTVQGNYIGTNATGTAAPVAGGSTGVGVLIEGARNTLVGGTLAGAGNVIANYAAGVQIAGLTGNIVQGNFIGTNAAGAAALGNTTGVVVSGGVTVRDNIIGGNTAAARNVISGNRFDGISIPTAFNTLVQGNYIGVAADGISPLPNGGSGGHGIRIGGSNNQIGGTGPGEGNVIAFNAGAGVLIPSVSALGNFILGNSIHSNTALGIDLSDSGLANGPTPNDTLDPDAGGNSLQNFPVLTSVNSVSGTTTVQGSINSLASTQFRIELFSNVAADPSGFGEGQTFFGSTPVTTDSSGNAAFSFPAPTPAGTIFTATATRLSGQGLLIETSEFSATRAAQAACSLIVTNTLDTGPGSFREAINCSNSTVGVLDTISFNVSGAGVRTISPTSALPTITDPVIIDGYTQPGASANTLAVGDNAVLLVELNGASAGTVDGLTITAGGSTVRGLVINGFARGFGASSDEPGGRGILLQTNGGNFIQGNFIGTNAAGTTAVRNDQAGVMVLSSSNNRIGGTTAAARNLISGHSSNGTGVAIGAARFGVGGNNNIVQGNYIGTDRNGAAALSNVTGVALDGSSDNTIGGTVPGAGNVISGHSLHGIFINTSGNRVQGNFIGLDATGTQPIVNRHAGVHIVNTFGNVIGGDDDDDGTLDGVVHARNVISGNGVPGASPAGGVNIAYGITVAQPNFVLGNFIGTDVTGTQAVANSFGVAISGESAPNVVGGPAAGAGNLISGNTAQGISLISGELQPTIIQGNLIGTEVDGVSPLGNLSHGIISTNDSITIGGSGPGEGNTIAFNGGAGVVVTSCCGGNVARSNAILSNSIYSNAGLGIDLIGDGVTQNDNLDPDTGPNNLQNFPVITSATSLSGTTTVQGTLNSLASTQFRIELFANAAADSSGFGEGQTFFGSTNVTTDGSGNATFSFPAPTPAGTIFTATATRLNGQGLPNETSEFSAVRAIQATCSLIVTTTTDTINASDSVNSLREAIICANATPGADMINLPAGTYTLTIGGADENEAATGDLDITDELTIIGAASGTTFIQAGTLGHLDTGGPNGIDRVFHSIDGVRGPTNVSLSGVTVRHGNPQFNGGGIFHEATGMLTATGTVVTNNQAGGIGGGGIRTLSGPVFLTDSTVSNNRTSGAGSKSGGGIQTNSGPLTLLRTTLSGNTADSDGGGIRAVFANVSVTDSTISGNTSRGFDGGGIHNDSGTVTITRSTISGNSAEDGGGILTGPGPLIVVSSIFSGNTATGLDSNGNSSNGVGGGIASRGGNPRGSLSITDSTIHGNTAALSGGGINIQQNIDLVTITRSTISANTVTGASGNPGSGAGGGINAQNNSIITLTNVTVSGNTAQTNGGGIQSGDNGFTTMNITNSTITDNTTGGNGGGIFSDPLGTVNLHNTLIAENFLEDAGTSFDVSGAFSSQGHNLIGIGDGSTGLTDGVNDDQVGTSASPLDPQLGPLANNGGPTQTHLPAPGAPSFDAGDDAVLGPPLSLTTDQRGAGFPRLANAHVDIGAVEGAPAAVCSLIVTTTLDGGPGSLRAAITCANDTPNINRNATPGVDPDPITFTIPANDLRHFYYVNDNVAGQVTLANVTATTAATDATLLNPDPDWPNSWFSIQVGSVLPTITDPAIIDGYTQTSASENTLAVGSNTILKIEVASRPDMTFGFGGFSITSGDSTLRGLAVNRFANPQFVGIPGIVLSSDSNVVEGNFIGTDVSGTLDLGNGTHGVFVPTGANNRIGGTARAARNLISGNGSGGSNTGNGIVIGSSGDQFAGPVGTRVLGNYIGTNADGTAALPNADSGIVVVEGADNLIGGDDDDDGQADGIVASRNVISGHPASGILTLATESPGIEATFVFDLAIQGNYLGLNAAGLAALPNTDGVTLSGDFIRDIDVTIGGITPGAGNVMSGNRTFGLRVFNVQTLIVQGNFVGTDITGILDLGNGAGGVFLAINPNLPLDYALTIGGTTAAARNIISGNDGNIEDGVGFGIDAGGQTTGFLDIQRNLIGTQIDGITPLPNSGHGVVLSRSATVGGLNPANGNVIAHNGGDGVVVKSFNQPGATAGMTILGNSIFSNASLGIDLNDDGITPNDLTPTPDEDTGPNKLQNFPAITSGTISAGMLTITYSVPSAEANSTYPIRVEFFKADSDGHEGQTFIGSDIYSAPGPRTVAFSPLSPVAPGDKLVATATDSVPAVIRAFIGPLAVLPGDPNNTSEFSPSFTLQEPVATTADLSVTKTDGVTTAVPGSNLTYTIVVSNAGPAAISRANEIQTVTVSGSTGGTFQLTFDNQTTSPPLPATATAALVLTRLSALSTIGGGNAAVTGPNGGPFTITFGGTLAGRDVSQLTANAVGGAVVNISTQQNGMDGVIVTDNFPTILTNVTYTSAPAGGATGNTASGSGNILDNLNLPVGASVTYTATGTVGPFATGTLSNTVTVTAPAGITDTNPGNNSATDVDTLTPRADLSITKTDGVVTATPGTSLTYTIVVGNSGPSAVTGATVSDIFPAAFTGATFMAVGTGTASGFASGSGNINQTVNLPVGSTITYMVTGTIGPSATGTLSNTATVSVPNGVTDPNPNNSSAIDTDTLIPQADLSITKSDGVTTAVPGTNLTYTIVVSNSGPSAVTGANVSDTFPSVFTGATFTAVGAGNSSGFANGSGNINQTVNLPVGSTITYTVNGTISPSATGILSNTVNVTPPNGVTDPNPNNSSAVDTDTLTPQADLSITKTDGVVTAVPGMSLTYTIVVSNSGPSAVTGASIIDTFPAAFTGAIFMAQGTGGASGFSNGSGNINQTVNLPVGSSITYTVTGTISPSATSTLSNIASVVAPSAVTDPNPNNSSAVDTDTLMPQADLSITKTDGVTNVAPGTTLTYTIVVRNTGPSAVTGATVSDTFAATFTGATFTAVGAGNASGFASGSGNINQTVNLPVGSTITYTVTGTVSPDAAGALINTATVTPPTGVIDPNPNNSSAIDTDTIIPRGSAFLVLGADAHAKGKPAVSVYDFNGVRIAKFLAYESNYRGGVRVATGDVNGDGILEIITAPGRSHTPLIKVFTLEGVELPNYSFLAYAANFTGGVYVAVGDLLGDNLNDIVVTPAREGKETKGLKNGGSEVRVYENKLRTNAADPFVSNAPDRKFLALPPSAIGGVKFIGGAMVATGDIQPGGKQEVIVGSNSGLRATVRAFNVEQPNHVLVQSWLPFNKNVRGGVFVTTGRIDGDLATDIIFGASQGGNGLVEIRSGATGALLHAAFKPYVGNQKLVSSQSAVRVVAKDIEGDGVIDSILVGQGPDGRTKKIRQFAPLNNSAADFLFENDADFSGGFHLA